MKKAFILSIFILVSIICRADYSPILLPSLIEKSELIAHIRITKNLKDNFEAKILNQLKGKSKSKIVIVKKFEDWTCAQRWSEYSVGQEEIIFLKKHREENYWVIMGAGNEGEMPIEKDRLYYKSPIYKSEFLEEEKYCELKSGKIHAVEYDLKDAIEGIKSYLEKVDEIDKMLVDKTIIKFYPKSKFFQRAIDEKILRNRREFSDEELKKRKFKNKN